MNAISGFFSGVQWKSVIIAVVITVALLMILGRKG